MLHVAADDELRAVRLRLVDQPLRGDRPGPARPPGWPGRTSRRRCSSCPWSRATRGTGRTRRRSRRARSRRACSAHRSCPDRSVMMGWPGSCVIHGAFTAVPTTVNSSTSPPSSPPLPRAPMVTMRSRRCTPTTASAPTSAASCLQAAQRQSPRIAVGVADDGDLRGLALVVGDLTHVKNARAHHLGDRLAVRVAGEHELADREIAGEEPAVRAPFLGEALLAGAGECRPGPPGPGWPSGPTPRAGGRPSLVRQFGSSITVRRRGPTRNRQRLRRGRQPARRGWGAPPIGRCDEIRRPPTWWPRAS